MTNNMDEFEQDQFDADSGMENGNGKPAGSAFENLRSKPIFKLVVIMGVVGVAVAGALGVFSSKPDLGRAQISAPPDVKGTPGGSASPFYMEQNRIANEQRVDDALKEKGSALPTPVGQNSDLLNMDELSKKDPLVEFRAETDRIKQELRAEQQQNAVKLQLMQQQMQQQAAVAPRQQDDSLAQSMQRQMQQLMESWTPRNMKVVAGAVEPAKAVSTDGFASNQGLAGQAASAVPAKAEAEAKAVIPSGTVNYAQLLTEANSDVPGPVMVQLLSGPLSGGRAIGTFKTMYEHLVLTFNVISYKGKDYPINAIALNPDTTLSGMATEVDHRYFMRLVLPAAASFMSAFGSAMGSANTTTTVNGDSVIVDQAKKGYDDALYDGLGQVGESIAGFFQQEAAQTKTLVRVAAGTPMGLFFLQPVMDKPGVGGQLYPAGMSAQDLLMQGYQQQIMPAYQQQMSGYGASQQPYTQAAPVGYNYPQPTAASTGVDLSTLTNNRSGTSGVKLYYNK